MLGPREEKEAIIGAGFTPTSVSGGKTKATGDLQNNLLQNIELSKWI